MITSREDASSLIAACTDVQPSPFIILNKALDVQYANQVAKEKFSALNTERVSVDDMDIHLLHEGVRNWLLPSSLLQSLLNQSDERRLETGVMLPNGETGTMLVGVFEHNSAVYLLLNIICDRKTRAQGSSFASTLLQNVSAIKESIVDAMGVPMIGCTAESNVLVANRVARHYFESEGFSLKGSTFEDMYSRWKLFDADFGKLITLDDYPLVKVMQKQKPVNPTIFGVCDRLGERRLVEMGGSAVFQGEKFCGGVIWLREVTEQLSEVAKQVNQARAE